MGQILFKMALEMSVSKKPANGQAINEQDFSIAPPMNISLSNMNEDNGSRFMLAASATDVAIGMGTVTEGKILFIQPSADMDVKITNAAGETQNIRFQGGFPSILAITFIGIKLTNPSATDVLTGKIFIVGDQDA